MEEKRLVHVLLLEDNAHVAELITEGFTGVAKRELGGRIGFAFEVCTNGQVALERLRTSRADLIISDVYMPVMDGPAFLRHVRTVFEGLGHHIPVIALSAGGAVAREAALAAGADVFLDKPIRLAVLLREVRRLLRL